MTRRLMGVALLSIAANVLLSQTPVVNIPITVSDGVGSKTLYFGLDQAASDGIDTSLGESELPPLPPTGVFDARYVGSDVSIDIGEGLTHDYRSGTATTVGERIHELQYQVGEGEAITINWELPDTISGELQDLYTGRIIDVPMRGNGSFVVTNPSVYSKLKMTMRYNFLKASVKVFLEGSFNEGLGIMNKTLNSGGLLAVHFAGDQIPTEAVDSINIEVRDSASAVKSLMRRFAPAWLLTDGTIRNFSDTTVSFVELEAPHGDYYTVVRHRNHLAVMSATPVALSSSSAIYDFTASQSQAYTTGPSPMKDLGGVKFGMYAGDANGDGSPTIADRVLWRLQNGGPPGYFSADFNLNGDVTIADRVLWRLNNGWGTQVP